MIPYVVSKTCSGSTCAVSICRIDVWFHSVIQVHNACTCLNYYTLATNVYDMQITQWMTLHLTLLLHILRTFMGKITQYIHGIVFV